jgi:hypothetical protein
MSYIDFIKLLVIQIIMTNFADCWDTAKTLKNFGFLNDWKIKSIREYHSKKGIKAHVVFEYEDSRNGKEKTANAVTGK